MGTIRKICNQDFQIDDCVRQRTLKNAAFCSGVGLHSGTDVTLNLIPAQSDTGIVFRRNDVVDLDPVVPATWDRVVDTRLCTVIGNEDRVTVGTIEHLMAALAGCGIDNLIVEIDGPEVPIMDGSSEPFVDLIERAGVLELAEPRYVIRILKPVNVRVGESHAHLIPAEQPVLDVEIDFHNAVVAKQSLSIGLVNGAFCKELAGARTFGFIQEVEQMQAAGFAKGGSLENAVVVSNDGILNDGGLRFDDEFVRHKMLDVVGDLYLAGGHIIGEFRGFRSGHMINNSLLRALFSDCDAWTVDVMRSDEAATAVDGGIMAEPFSVGAPS